jgi:sulfur-oxidizing protein SoxX
MKDCIDPKSVKVMSPVAGRDLTPRTTRPPDTENGKQPVPKSLREHAMQAGRSARPAVTFAGAALRLALFAAALTSGAALAQQPSAPMPGETLAFDRSRGNCLTCHVIKGGDAPGNVGPELANMKARYPDRKELRAIISDETKRNPQTVMPPFGRNLILTGEEIEAVIDFLYTR